MKDEHAGEGEVELTLEKERREECLFSLIKVCLSYISVLNKTTFYKM